MRLPNPFRFFRRADPPAARDAPRPPVLTLQERRLLLGLLLLFGLGLAARALQLRQASAAARPPISEAYVPTSATPQEPTP